MDWMIFIIGFSLVFWFMSRHLKNDGYKLKMYLSFMFFSGLMFWVGFLPVAIMVLGYTLVMYNRGKMKHVD